MKVKPSDQTKGCKRESRLQVHFVKDRSERGLCMHLSKQSHLPLHTTAAVKGEKAHECHLLKGGISPFALSKR